MYRLCSGPDLPSVTKLVLMLLVLNGGDPILLYWERGLTRTVGSDTLGLSNSPKKGTERNRTCHTIHPSVSVQLACIYGDSD